jgi:hypothetical protein
MGSVHLPGPFSFTTGSELRVDGGYLAMGPEQAAPPIGRLAPGASASKLT